MLNEGSAVALAREAAAATTLLEVLAYQAREHGHRSALHDLGDGTDATSLTYAELDARARAVAVELRARCRPSDRVLLLVRPCADFVSAFFGCLYAGAVPIPLAARLNRNAAATVARIMRDAQSQVLLVSPDVAAGADLAALLPDQRVAVVNTAEVTADPAAWQPPQVGGPDVAFFQYTSGTTHSPKGVMVTHRNLLQNLRMIGRAFAFRDDTVMASWLPAHHDMGLIGTILAPIYLGVPTALMQPASFIQQPVRWLEAVTRYGATVSGGPNFAYDLCSRRVSDAELDGLDLGSWGVAFNGAERVRPETLRMFSRRFASVGFDPSAFLPCYGLAEATLLVAGRSRPTGARVGRFDAARLSAGVPTVVDECRLDAPPSADQPAPTTTEAVACELLPGVDVQVVDAAGRPVDDGMIGEIWVSGASITAGYWNRPAESAATFDAHLVGSPTAAGYLRTGDLGFRVGDDLYIRGRLKDIIVVRGQNHYPDDIEATLRTEVPAVAGRVVAFGADSGDAETLVVWYEADPDTAADTAAATAAAARREVRRAHGVEVWRIIAVPPGAIPVTTSGKVRRAECVRRYLDGGYPTLVEDPLRPDAPLEGGPRPPTDLARVREIVGEVLGVSAELIDLRLTPEELGLDSLKAVEFQNAVESALGVRPTMADLFGERALGDLFGGPPVRSQIAPSPPVDPTAPYPLSYGQRSIWFQGQLAVDAGNLNLSRAVAISGELDVSALTAALGEVARRHPALNTSYTEVGGELRQRIDVDTPGILAVHDTADWSPERLTEAIESEAAAAFAVPPLLRLALYRRRPGGETLQLTVHHSVMDVWALAVLIEDLVACYAANIGAPAESPPPGAGVHPAEFVHWQQAFIDSAEGREIAARWPAEFADVPPLRLPTDHPRPPTRSFRGAAHPFRLDAALSNRIRELAADSGVGVSAVIFAGYAAMLARYCGQQRFALSFAHCGRTHARFTRLVAYLVNPLPIPIDLDAAPDFRCLVRAASAAVLSASDRAAFPFTRLATSGDGLDGGLGKLISATFAMQQSPGTGRLGLAPLVMNHAGGLDDWAGLPVAAVPVRQRACYFDLSLYVSEHADHMLANFDYSTDLFDAATVEVLAEVLTTLLTAACALPDAPVSALPLLVGARRELVVRQWSRTAAGYSTDECVHQLIEAQAHRTPSAPAVLSAAGRLTYRQLNEQANRLAHRLIKLGAAPGVPVGILLPRSPASLVAVLAVLKSGAPYLPLDPAYPLERLRFMVADSAATILVTDPHRAGDFPDLCAINPSEADLADEHADDPPIRCGPDDVAYVVYTSGSTGAPHGVLGLHRGNTSRQRWMLGRFPFGHNEVGSHKTSLSFFDSGGEMFLPLCAGAPVVVVSEEAGRDPVQLVSVLAEHRVTRLVAVPSLLRSILDTVPDVGRRLSALRFCHSSGEPLTPEVAGRWLAALPQCTLVDLYGSSELSADVTVDVITDAAQVGSVGRPVGNAQIYVLDDRLQPLPARFAGEIYVGGIVLARGYLGRPDLTAAKFVPDPIGGTGARLFRTGDRGRWRHDGRLEYLGRVDHQVKIRGFRIELGEVEAALRAHPGVRAAVAAAVDGPVGHERRLVATVVPASSDGSTDSDQDGFEVDRVGDWQRLYERVYADAGTVEQRQLAIWTDSYTGRPFTAVEMSEWIDQAVERIRELRPRELLEIGCGTGNLVLALAPECDRYVATDFSSAGLDVLRDKLSLAGCHAELLLREAVDTAGLAARSFDTVVLNSVTQYFPSHDYLLKVLRGAVEMTRDGGRVFVGDVRDLDLVHAFHTSVELARDEATQMTAAQLRSRIRKQRDEEEELVVAQDFFALLSTWLPRVSRVDFRLKRGRHINELNAFRYDVIISVGQVASAGAADAPRPTDPRTLHWHPDQLDFAALRALLRDNKGLAVQILDVPNARVCSARDMVAWLPTRADGLRGVPPDGSQAEDALDPEDVWALGLASGRPTDIVPAASRDPYAMDLRFHPPAHPDLAVAWTGPTLRRTDWPALANHPLRVASRQRFMADLRAHVRRRLPEFMVPVLDVVDELPTTATGKVSRLAVAQAWSQPGVGAPRAAAPEGPQEPVAAVWRNALGSDTVGVDDNFFDVGGNSLSLVRVHLELQEMIGREFPLVRLYEHTTIRKITAFLAGLGSGPAAAPPDEAPRREQSRERQAAQRRELIRERARGNR